jgi:hypothetical protein
VVSHDIPSGVKARLARILQKRTWGKPADHALAEVNEVVEDLDEQGYIVVPRTVLNELALCAVAFLQPYTTLTVVPDRGVLVEYMQSIGWEEGMLETEWTKNI